MVCLDDKEQRWYCFKDDQVFYAIKNLWTGAVPAPSKQVCANCGNILAVGSRFCKECGAKVTAPTTKPDTLKKTARFCANCGNSLAVGSKFCKECGTAIQLPAHVMVQPTSKSCHHCGARIAFEAEICPKCGVRVSATTNLKNEAIAAVLSFIWMGLGQIYVGREGRGIILAAVEFFFVTSGGFGGTLLGLLWFITIPLWVWNIYDAYKSAKEYNSKWVETGKSPW